MPAVAFKSIHVVCSTTQAWCFAKDLAESASAQLEVLQLQYIDMCAVCNMIKSSVTSVAEVSALRAMIQ